MKSFKIKNARTVSGMLQIGELYVGLIRRRCRFSLLVIFNGLAKMIRYNGGPILISFFNTCFEILIKKIIGLFSMLKNQSAVFNLINFRINRAQFADTDGVSAKRSILRRVVLRLAFKQLLVVCGCEPICSAIVLRRKL